MIIEKYDKMRMNNVECLNTPSPPNELPFWYTLYFSWSLNDKVKKYVEEKREKEQANKTNFS